MTGTGRNGKAIGRLALTYSALDESVERCVSALLYCDDPDVAQYIARSYQFGKGLEVWEGLIGHYRKTYFLEDSSSGLALMEDIATIKKLSIVRNDIMHGSLEIAYPERRPIAFWNKKRSQPAEPHEIDGAAEMMESIACKLDGRLWAFRLEINRQNEPMKQSLEGAQLRSEL